MVEKFVRFNYFCYLCTMISEMDTIQILSSKLREEELENERLRRERDAESEKALRAVEDARVARESAEQYRIQLEEERKAQGDRIESMLKEVMMFITGKGTASLSESLSDSIIKKMQEQHARELAEQKATDEERFRKMDEEHRIREAALESRIRELEDVRNHNNDHDQSDSAKESQRHFNTLEEAEAAYLNEKRKNDDLTRLRFAQSTEGKHAGRNAVDTSKNRKHYLGKWLHNIISPKAKLSNYLYRDGDRGAYIAAEYLIGAIDFFLHCDGAKMYKSFEKGGKYEDMGIIRVGCGSHVRRPFWKLRLTEVEARWITEKMDSIFVKEDSYKGLPDEERKRRRGEEVAPILHEIKQRLDILKGEKSAPDAWKHPGLYEAVDYALREWAGIQNYLLTGSGDYTNNICEREMRIVATLRNNSLFWGSHTSAERLSVILTIVRSALMNSLNVYQYIVYCLKTIRKRPNLGPRLIWLR